MFQCDAASNALNITRKSLLHWMKCLYNLAAGQCFKGQMIKDLRVKLIGALVKPGAIRKHTKYATISIALTLQPCGAKLHRTLNVLGWGRFVVHVSRRGSVQYFFFFPCSLSTKSIIWKLHKTKYNHTSYSTVHTISFQQMKNIKSFFV